MGRIAEITIPHARRRELIETAGWLTEPEARSKVGDMLSTEDLRAASLLLGAWDDQMADWWYPAFQFRPHGGIRPVVADLLELLPAGDPTSWDRIAWLYSANALTMGAAPEQIIETDPGRVLAAARADFPPRPGAHDPDSE